MYLKNEDVKIGTIPDANGSDTPLRKMEFLTKKEAASTEKSSYHQDVPLLIILMKMKGKLIIFFRELVFTTIMVQSMKYTLETLHLQVMVPDMPLRILEMKILYLWH